MTGHRTQHFLASLFATFSRAFLLVLIAPALAWASDPQIASFTDTPDPVAAGGVYEYGVRVDNNAALAAQNTRLTLTVPDGATFVSASPAGANCAPTSATTVVCNLGVLGGSGTDVRDITVRWRATGPGPTTVTATAVLSADNDINLGNNTQTQTTTVISGANLGLTKTGSPNPVIGGAPITYTLTASNSGPNASDNIVITDTLPPSVSFVSGAGAGWTCGHAGGVVTCSRPGPHPVNAPIPPVTVVGTVTASGGIVTNSATVSPAVVGGTADPDSSNNTRTVNTTVLPGADVRIAQKSVTSALPAIAGSTVTFLIQPRNGGPADATSVVVSDPLPAGWAFVSASGPGWACSAVANTVQCSRAVLPAGATDNITVVATAPPNAAVAQGGQVFINTASIAATSNDPDTSNNASSTNVPVLRDGADLRAEKSKTPNPVALGGLMTSELYVANNGPRRATGPLRMVEVLSGESFVSFSGAGWTCDASAPPVVVCDNPNTGGLGVDEFLQVTVVTRADVAGTVRNTLCVSNSVPGGANPALARPPLEGDPNTSNNCASTGSNATTVQPDLAISKATSTPTGGDKTVSASENSVTYTLRVSNVSLAPQSATGIVITDTVPAFIAGRSSFASITATASVGSTATFGCASTGATVTCTQTGGALLQGQTVTVAIVVNRPLQEGNYTNTATVFNTVEGDPDASNNSASDTVRIDPIADVEMTGKTVTPTTVRAGEVATFVLSYRNNGPSPADGVTVRDTLTFPGGAETGVTVVGIASSKPGSSCNLAVGAVLTAANNNFQCAVGTLANGETQSITLEVRPNFVPGNPARNFSNLARVDTTTAESPSGGDNGNNTRSANLAVSPAALDLLVNKTDRVGAINLDPVPYSAGNTFLGYQVAVTNNGPSFGTGVRVTENMMPPAGRRVRFVCDTTTFGGSTCNAVPLCSVSNVTSAAGTAIPAFSCQVPPGTAATGPAAGELASGARKNIFLRFEALDQPAPTGDIFSNTATVSANEPDTQAANNSETEQTTTRQQVDLRTTKTASVASPTLFQPFNWIVTVVNNGPGNSLQTDLTDTLPPQVEVTGPITWTRTLAPATGTCTRVAATVTCALGQLNAAGAATITIPVRITGFPAGGTLTNSATVDTNPDKTGAIDFPGGNNTGSSTLTVLRSSLAGTVFEDRVRSGANGGTPQDASVEPRLGGVTIALSGSDAYGNVLSGPATTTSTDPATGSYVFTDLPPSGPGGYTITQNQPAGFDNGPVSPPASGANAPSLGGSFAAGGAAGNSSYTAVAVGTSDTGIRYNFPEVRRPSISGFVYIDLNGDGVRNAGTDAAIPGATVRLLDASSGAVVATTATDAAGAYSFSGLNPLIPYVLEQALPSTPAGLGNGPVNPGLINGAPCAAGCTAQPNAPVAGTDRIAAIDLSSGTDGTQFNFGEVLLAGISGLVWVDTNRDTLLDASETVRLSGVTLRLVQGADCTSGTTLQTTSTAADGSYRFDGLRALQNYLVCQTQPAGYGTGSAAGVSGSNFIAVNNLPAAGSAGNNFGETLASLAGSVYADTGAGIQANFNNGVRDAGESGIANVPVTLSGTDVRGNAVNITVTTDASGNYRFDNLLASNAAGYTLTEGAIPAPSGSFVDGRETVGTPGGSAAVNDAISGIQLAAGEQGAGHLFGELSDTNISGTVYIDRDRDNAIGPVPTDGRIPGVTVRLVQGADCTSGTTLRTTTTDGGGNYSFSGVSPGGSYLICQTQPPGYANGTENPGGSASSGGTNGIVINNLPASGSSGNHFGERVGSIAGSVYLDTSNDGTRQGSESGIGGVTVTLTGTDAAGNAVSRSLTTDASGNYRFDDLLAAGPGGYSVTEQAAQPVVNGVTTLDGRTNAGSTGGSGSGVASPPSRISGIALAAGADSIDNRFGELLPVAIGGVVFIDVNDNGLLNAPADAGLPGVTIVITGTDDTGAAVTRSLTTAADGTYAVTDLRPGTYTVTEPTQPTGTSNGQTVPGSAGGTATPTVTTPSAIVGVALLTGGASSSANNFAELPAAEIAGTVYADNNNNGLIDSGETGLAGVTLVLTGTDDQGSPVRLTTTTGADGRYSFPGLRPGTYAVTQPTQPPGTVNGITTPGSAGGTATGTAVLPSAIGSIVLTPGTRSLGNHFGEIANSPDLRVSKSLVEPQFTVGFAGSYRISVRNTGDLASSGAYTVSDRLPAGLTLLATPTGSGWTCVGALAASTFSCTSSSVIAAGATGADFITANVNVAAAAATGPALNNVVLVDGGGEIEARRPSAAERDAFNNNPAALPVCSAAVEHNVCRTPTPVQLAASISGSVWFDVGTGPRLLDGGDRALGGWNVEVVDPATGAIVGRATTGGDGSYRVPGLLPGVPLAVRFRDPVSGVIFGYPVNGHTAPGSSGAGCNPGAALGAVSSCIGTGASPFLTVVLAPGQDLPQQSLPVDPSGVVYDSGLRQPVPGSIVSLEPVGVCTGWAPATGLVGAGLGGYRISGNRVSMTVGSEGFYQFLFAPSAPASCTWQLAVTPPSGYTFQSSAIAPTPGPLVPGGAPGSVFNVQPQAAPPTGAVGTATTYYLTLTGGSGGANIVHNHIPLDPFPPSAISLSKTGDKATAVVGDSVRYTITVSVTAGARPRQTTVVDRLPAGFTYIRGTAMVGDTPLADPTGGLGPTLAFNLGPVPASNQLVLRYRVRVGVGAMQGDGVNRARGHSCGVPLGCVDGNFTPLAGTVSTNEALFRVRVNAGVFTTDTCVLGKIFVDCNNNHVQDKEELGIPGVRLVMQDGTTLVSDSEGKYSVCGVPAKSAVLKVDPITLPRGSRLGTSSNRNLGDAGSLWLDLKNGELHRADFVEASCSNTVLEQVKARRAQGEVRAPESEKKGGPALRFDSKAHGLSTTTSPPQGTDGANQRAPKPRQATAPPAGAAAAEDNVPSHELPMNRPPPTGRDSGTTADIDRSAGGAK